MESKQQFIGEAFLNLQMHFRLSDVPWKITVHGLLERPIGIRTTPPKID
jgi:hypothetical protein